MQATAGSSETYQVCKVEMKSSAITSSACTKLSLPGKLAIAALLTDMLGAFMVVFLDGEQFAQDP